MNINKKNTPDLPLSDSICPTVSDNFFGMDLTDIDKNVACQIWQEIMKRQLTNGLTAISNLRLYL